MEKRSAVACELSTPCLWHKCHHFPEENHFENDDGHQKNKIWPTFRGALIHNLILACALIRLPAIGGLWSRLV